MTTKVNDCINHANVMGMGMVREEGRKDLIQDKQIWNKYIYIPFSENKGNYIYKNKIEIIIKKKNTNDMTSVIAYSTTR